MSVDAGVHFTAVQYLFEWLPTTFLDCGKMNYYATTEKLSIQDIGLVISACAIVGFIIRRITRSNFVIRHVLRALRVGGPVPKHVAFIMDGNRRWARKSKLAVREGHARGGEKLTESLQWCLDAGVQYVTVYAFSLENYKRPRSEVEELMKLCEAKFREMLDNCEVIHRNRVRVRVIGDLSRVPKSLQTLMNQIMARTSHHRDGPTLNICFSYTSRNDIASSITKLAELYQDNKIRKEDIDESILAAYLSTGYANGADATAPYPELLIRTSGETRLSDFLLWEGCYSVISFCDVLWPELSPWNFISLILDYQTRQRARNATLTFDTTNASIEFGWQSNNCNKQVRDCVESSRAQYFQTISSVEKSS